MPLFPSLISHISFPKLRFPIDLGQVSFPDNWVNLLGSRELGTWTWGKEVLPVWALSKVLGCVVGCRLDRSCLHVCFEEKELPNKTLQQDLSTTSVSNMNCQPIHAKTVSACRPVFPNVCLFLQILGCNAILQSHICNVSLVKNILYMEGYA